MGTTENDIVECFPRRRHVFVCHSVQECDDRIKQECESTLTQYCQNHHGKNYGKGMVLAKDLVMKKLSSVRGP